LVRHRFSVSLQCSVPPSPPTARRKPRKRRNAAAAPRPGGGLERGRRSGPHHRRRGLHGAEQELHQGLAGAVHLPPASPLPAQISPLPNTRTRSKKRDDFYSYFFPSTPFFYFSRRSGGFLMVAICACRSSRTCGRSSTPPPSTARSPTSTASRSRCELTLLLLHCPAPGILLLQRKIYSMLLQLPWLFLVHLHPACYLGVPLSFVIGVEMNSSIWCSIVVLLWVATKDVL
jgi:hypothetical protein